MSISFIVPTYIETKKHLEQLQKCIESIVAYAPYKSIYVINDSGDEYNNDILKAYFEYIPNLIFKKTINKGSAELQAHWFILNDIDDEADYYFLMHDSMYLNKPLKDISDVRDVQFLWYFTTHIPYWEVYVEPETDFNIANKIVTHKDLLDYHIKNFYTKDPAFQEYALNALVERHLWRGCFGTQCIIKRDVIKTIYDKTNYADIFLTYTSKRNRMVAESIFAILCQYYYDQNYENALNGQWYGHLHSFETHGLYVTKQSGNR